MDRDRAIGHLKDLIISEERLAVSPRPYLDKSNQRRAEQMHWNNVQALRLAVSELEDFKPIMQAKGGTEPCPEPIQEFDEYRCTKCNIRWDTKEDKPPCRG